jgi:hypothetical protein
LTPIFDKLITLCEVQAKSTRDRPGPDAASSLLEAGKVWRCGRDQTPRSGLAAAGNRARAARRLPLLTKLAAFTSVGRKICESSEGLLQRGNCTRTAAKREFPAISPTLVRPPNPEPYQGSPDAAASGFQRCKKERPMHQDHLPAEKFSIKHRREPAGNQGIFSRPADLGTWRSVAAGFTRLGHRPSGRLPISLTLQYNPGKISLLSRRPRWVLPLISMIF